MKLKSIIKRPYFLKDKSWYYYDYKEMKYKLTDKAPEEAKKSYKRFYKLIEED